MVGLGCDAGLPLDCPDICPREPPEVPRHSVLADVLQEQPSLFFRLHESRTTGLGVSFAGCVKMASPAAAGDPSCPPSCGSTSLGLLAGDSECYDAFADVFGPVLRRSLGRELYGRHPTDLAIPGSLPSIDSSGQHLLSCEVRISRCLRRFRFPPAASAADRVEVEQLLVPAFLSLQGNLAGSYLPLRGSMSYPVMPGGMTARDEEDLRRVGLLFEPPSGDSAASGSGWPTGRGVFTNKEHTFAIWVNEQEHLRAVSSRSGDSLQHAFADCVRALDLIAKGVNRNAEAAPQLVFASSERLGFLTANPGELGTCLSASLTLRLPRLAEHLEFGAQWRAWCARQRVTVRSGRDGSGAPLHGVFQVSNIDRLGVSEAAILVRMATVAASLVEMERRLEDGRGLADMLRKDVEPAMPFIKQAAVQRSAPAGSARAAVAKARATLMFSVEAGCLFDAMKAIAGPTRSADAAQHAALAAETPCPISAGGASSTADADAVVESIVLAAVARDAEITSPSPALLHKPSPSIDEHPPPAGDEVRPVTGDQLPVTHEQWAEDIVDKLVAQGMQQIEAGIPPSPECNAPSVLTGDGRSCDPSPLPAHTPQPGAGPERRAAAEPARLDASFPADRVNSFNSFGSFAARIPDVSELPPAIPVEGAEDALPQFDEEPVLCIQELKGRFYTQLSTAYQTGELETIMANAMTSADDEEEFGSPDTKVCKDSEVPEVSSAAASTAATTALPVTPVQHRALERATPPAPSKPTAPGFEGILATQQVPIGFMQQPSPALKKALEAASQQERRIGELLAHIRDTEVLLAEKGDECRRLEEQIARSKLDLAHLDLDVEWHKRALDSATDRSSDLESGQRKLALELDGHQQKVRHAFIDHEQNLLSARSDYSTSAGSTLSSLTIAGASLFTPMPWRASLEPLPFATR